MFNDAATSRRMALLPTPGGPTMNAARSVRVMILDTACLSAVGPTVASLPVRQLYRLRDVRSFIRDCQDRFVHFR